MSHQPQKVNENHFSTEKFPEVIAFCERDESTHIKTSSEESYDYGWFGNTRYTLKKFASQWELQQIEDHNIVRVATGRSLGLVLWQGLRFAQADKAKQEERVNVLIPIAKGDIEKALAFMYYYGGYPGNFLEVTPELAVILEQFVDPQLTFISYSYVPVQVLDWLRETLKSNEIMPEGMQLWVYKK